ncbi:hypothetical protein [Burkholderia ubonensis]|uniref:hypothetical protein n=1 Tax=Burkholderia ubonensis TaxID=101571 RepID=UPI0012F889E3|nr:hypothetical protein [Burkholderia ubonensis]
MTRFPRYWAQWLSAMAAGCGATSLALAAGLESPSSAGSDPSGSTVLAKSAQQVGVRRCYPAVDKVSARMLAGTQHADVVLDWDRRNPDGEPFFALTGLEYANAAAVTSLTTIPASAGGCTILVERISSEPLTCKAVAKSELRDYKGTQLVRAVTVYANPARPRETVTLVDAPSACLIIRRQVQFRWGAEQ